MIIITIYCAYAYHEIHKLKVRMILSKDSQNPEKKNRHYFCDLWTGTTELCTQKENCIENRHN